MRGSYQFPNLEGKRVLFVGLGGGCDVFTAYILAKTLPLKCQAYFGNTIGPRNLEGLNQVCPYILTPSGEAVPLVPGDPCYHTTKLECSLPRSELGPYIFVLPFRDGGDLEFVTEKNRSALLEDINKMNFDMVYGVDTGGDSLTGGIDWKQHPALGRDRQMLAVLANLTCPFVHLLVSPCSDGETTHEVMLGCMKFMEAEGRYHGSFRCDQTVFDQIKVLCSTLASSRTPNIMLQAHNKTLTINQDGMAIVPRGINPAVPLEWLTDVFAYTWPKGMKSDYALPVTK